jgi:hypothetical protein
MKDSVVPAYHARATSATNIISFPNDPWTDLCIRTADRVRRCREVVERSEGRIPLAATSTDKIISLQQARDRRHNAEANVRDRSEQDDFVHLAAILQQCEDRARCESSAAISARSSYSTIQGRQIIRRSSMISSANPLVASREIDVD